jgi:hypothetical protein
VQRSDIEQTARLVAELLRRLDAPTVERLREFD